MSNGLPYIADRKLYKAVMFSLSMMQEGLHPDIANGRAGKYYGVNRERVENYSAMAPPWMRGKGEPP